MLSPMSSLAPNEPAPPAGIPESPLAGPFPVGEYAAALRHDQSNPAYNASLRQLLHVGFKVAAKMGPRYLSALEANEDVIAKNVTENLFERHIKPIFLGV